MKRISKWLLTLVIVGFSTVSPITQTGIHFANIGKLIITTGGKLSVQLMPVEEITYTSPRVTATTDSIKSLLP